MQMMMTVLLVVQMLTALVMIGLVLIQHGKGADMGASFGSGASGSLFGATGSANFLSRSTAVLAAIFFASTLALAYFSNLRSVPGSTGGSSLLESAAPAAIDAVQPLAETARSGEAGRGGVPDGGGDLGGGVGGQLGSADRIGGDGVGADGVGGNCR